MKFFHAVLYILFFSFAFQQSSAAEPETVLSTVLRERCISILSNAAHHEDVCPEYSLRAASILLANGYSGEADPVVKRLESTPNADSPEALYLLAQVHRKNHERRMALIDKLVEKISSGTSMPADALKSLALLGYDSYSADIRAIAKNGNSPAAACALWIGANSGDTACEDSLIGLLESTDTVTSRTTAAALIELDSLGDRSFERLHSILQKSATNSPLVITACFVHAPDDLRDTLKGLMFSGSHDDLSATALIVRALAEAGTEDDIPRLEKLLGSQDISVRIEAANALLRIERRGFRGIGIPDWLVIVIYAAAMLGIGFYFSRRQKTSDDYLVGGRKVNPILSGISLFASYLSTITYLAVAGEVIKHGPLVFLIHIASIIVVYPVTAYFLIPLFMKMPITSAYEIIERPLGKGVRLTGSLIFLVTRFLWMALLIFLTSKSLVVMLNLDSRFILPVSIIAGIITVIYSTMGGLKAVITTDVTQFCILIFGALMTIVIVTLRLGGPAEWMPAAWAPEWDKLVFFSLSPYIRLTVVFSALHFLSWWISTAGSDQMAIQRFVATKDVRSARQAFLTAQLGEKILFIILISVGFALFSFYRNNPWFIPDGLDIVDDADFIFPNFIANQLPVGVSGLVIAAIFSAAMSSLSSGVNSTAAVFTTDILPWLSKKVYRDRERLKFARQASFAVGVLVVFLSVFIGGVPGNIMEVTAKTNGLFVCPLFNLFFMALFVPFATPFGTIMGSVYGVAVAFVIAFWDSLTGGAGITFLWIGPSSFFVSIGVSMLLSLLPTRGKSRGFILGLSIVFLLPIAVAIFILTHI